MLLAMSLLVGVAVVVFRQGLVMGPAETWMLLWVLAFVIVLPLVLLLLPALAAMVSRWTSIPHSGVKVP
jgi:hypothetical protein